MLPSSRYDRCESSMNSFRDHRLRDHEIPLSTVWLLNGIAESKGKQELFTRQSPQVLNALRDTAVVQSAEASNRIEGVVVAPSRLYPLVLGRSKPRDRSEQEVQDYRRALNEIHSGYGDLSISPEILQRLHAVCQSAAGDAGQFKRIDNDIVEFLSGQAPVVRFRCVKAADTPAAVEDLCRYYQHALDQEKIPPLIAIAALVLDFLCIHPFRDGNGRVSRLLTLLALYQNGYEVGRYISLERLIEESCEDYYECLRLSSQGRHDGLHELMPWFNFIFAIIRRAYLELEKRAGQIEAPRGAKSERVLAAIRARPGEFRLRDLERDCPGVGREWIRTLLAELKKSGEVACRGRGPGARWRFLKNEGSKA